MFAKYDLKYLEDPETEWEAKSRSIRWFEKDWKEDQPEAYKVLDNFHWSEKDSGKSHVEINNGKDPQQAAKRMDQREIKN